MDEIIYTTPDEQIEKLKAQNLTIRNDEFAKFALRLYGYSNLIKSYRDPYVITNENKKLYRSGVVFEQICSLYILDKNLRNGVMASMLDLEEYLKEQSADVIAQAFGTHQEQYLKYRNYRNKRKKKSRFMLSGILNTMQDALNSDKDPICHYRNKYGVVPPWILFKNIYFSTMVNFIDKFKTREQNELVHRLYNVQKLHMPTDSARKLMMDTLYICLNYRNTAAHGGRIYNHNCKNKLRVDEIFLGSVDYNFFGFSQLLRLLNFFRYQDPYKKLTETLNHEVNRHCHKFPQDVTYLGQILNIDIVKRNRVFISPTSNKYHLNPHCSGVKNAHELDLDEAIKQGFEPCKRCVK